MKAKPLASGPHQIWERYNNLTTKVETKGHPKKILHQQTLRTGPYLQLVTFLHCAIPRYSKTVSFGHWSTDLLFYYSDATEGQVPARALSYSSLSSVCLHDEHIGKLFLLLICLCQSSFSFSIPIYFMVNKNGSSLVLESRIRNIILFISLLIIYF